MKLFDYFHLRPYYEFGLKNLKDLSATQTENSAFGYVDSTDNNFISGVGSGANGKGLAEEPRNHVDIINKDTSLYKGANISGFQYENSEKPYMLESTDGTVNNIGSGDRQATFRAVIVGN